MNMYDLIRKKKEGGILDREEIRWMIDGYTKGNIPDYQMSAMMMAICFRGMNGEETGELTLAMRDSGDVMDLSAIRGIKVDKHSTGGVGDKTSIALLPLVSSLGVKIAKMSGRGLGHTGGTIDKLESIPGFRTSLSEGDFMRQVDEIGLALMGQTAELAPADKKLYALRDVTATVDQLSLIASSIMSKKLAAGADAIVLDVKCGSGAFMKEFNDAKALAEEMVGIGRHAGKKMRALITNMDQPLGDAVGNALEVQEAIDTLKGKGPADFTELVLALGARMLLLSEKETDVKAAEERLKEAIADGRALKQLGSFIRAQGGDDACLSDDSILAPRGECAELKAASDGTIVHMDCAEAGMASLMLGAGRSRLEDSIDPYVGIRFLKKTGDAVKAGETIALLYYSDEAKEKAAKERLASAIKIADAPAAERTAIILDEVE